MSLTPLHVTDVCYGGNWGAGGTTCKYIDSTVRQDGTWIQICTKLNPGAFAALEQKRKQWGQHQPTGDNCQGYLLLHHKQQGYDV